VHIPEGDSSRTALHNLWQHVRPQQEIRPVLTATSLAAASISVYGAAGGVGVTTISATLTRLLAKAGRRCAIFDQTGDSILPLFFGAQQGAPGQPRFAALHSLLQPRIRILSSELFEPIKAAPTGSPSFIERNFSGVAGELDHLIFDHTARCTDGVGAGLKICVAIPDLSSLTGAMKLMDHIEKEGGLVKSVCVLNRFNAASQFHQEVLSLYRQTFGDVVTIRDSQLLTEALAEGATIVDWAPDSAVSVDIVNLFAVVHQMLNSTVEGFSTRP
jgi:cellulose biosynthesis protein BcsQ